MRFIPPNPNNPSSPTPKTLNNPVSVRFRHLHGVKLWAMFGLWGFIARSA